MPTPLELQVDQLKAVAALIQKNTFCLVGELRLWLNISPKDWTEKLGHDFAEHSILGDRPKLQSVGNKLDELQMEFQLHAALADIGKTWDTLKGYKEAATAVPVTMGDGQYLGTFVITEMTFKRTATFANGTTLAAALSITFREYVKSTALVTMKRPRSTTSGPGTKKAPLKMLPSH
jgi:phage protein U